MKHSYAPFLYSLQLMKIIKSKTQYLKIEYFLRARSKKYLQKINAHFLKSMFTYVLNA